MFKLPQQIEVYLTVSRFNFLHAFFSADFFFKIKFLEKKIKNIIRVSNSLDPDQAQENVGPDLGLNCSHSLSADHTSR